MSSLAHMLLKFDFSCFGKPEPGKIVLKGRIGDNTQEDRGRGREERAATIQEGGCRGVQESKEDYSGRM